MNIDDATLNRYGQWPFKRDQYANLIAQLYAHNAGLVVWDIMMPEADGYEVLRTLKSSPETDDIPFIYLTASVERKEVQAGFDMGAKGYIRKPFDSDELFKTIEDCVKH